MPRDAFDASRAARHAGHMPLRAATPRYFRFILRLSLLRVRSLSQPTMI